MELNCIHYKYGTKTLKSLAKKNNAINALKEDMIINVYPDSHGFLNEKVFTNEVEFKMNLENEKKLLEFLICSNSTIDGKEHIKNDNPKKEEQISDKNNSDKSYLFNNSNILIKSSRIYPKLLTNENFGFTTKHVFHKHILSYSKITKNYKCRFCIKKFGNYQPSFHCRKCHYHLCIECISIKEYNTFFENMKKTNKIIKKFNSKKKIVNCGFHIHDLEKENVYNNNGFLCDLCFKVFNLSKAYHCSQCNFDLCDNCLETSEANENTKNQLILNEEISEVILGFKNFKNLFTKFLYFFSIFYSDLELESLLYEKFNIDKLYGFKYPIFFIKTKRNYEIVLEYGKFNLEQKEIISENKKYKVFYPNFVNIENNYFNTEMGEGIRIIEMNKDNYIKSTLTNFYLKINSDTFGRLYNLLESIAKTRPGEKNYYDCYSFATQFLKFTGGVLNFNRIFNKKDLYFLPFSILNQLKKNEN